MIERELKAVVADPERIRAVLERSGAVRGFTGWLADRRYDRERELTDRGEVLRIRTCRSATDGAVSSQLGWKGPVRVEDGYKLRAEHELTTDDVVEAESLVAALGYRECHAIDRFVEYYEVAGAVVRLEWYPRMDVLVEVEGSAAAIEAAVELLRLPRSDCSPDSLAAFAERYAARTGHAAAVALAELEPGERPVWDRV